MSTDRRQGREKKEISESRTAQHVLEAGRRKEKKGPVPAATERGERRRKLDDVVAFSEKRKGRNAVSCPDLTRMGGGVVVGEGRGKGYP